MKKAAVIMLAIVLFGIAIALQLGAPAVVSGATISVNVTANEKISLTMDDTTVDFASVDPGAILTSATSISSRVKANKAWDLSYTATGMDSEKGMPISQLMWGVQPDGADATPFDSSGTFVLNQPKTGNGKMTHYYTLDVPWTADPGAYSATVTYSATFH